MIGRGEPGLVFFDDRNTKNKIVPMRAKAVSMTTEPTMATFVVVQPRYWK